MAYPVNARYETRVAGTTTVKKAWADATDDSLIGLYGGGKTLVSLQVDGTGNAAASAAAGSVVAPLVAVGATGVSYTTSGVVHGYTYHGDLQTTNNSVLSIVSIPIPASRAISALANVVGLKTDLSTGGSYFSKGMFKNNAGTVTPIGGGGGTTLITQDEDDATWGGIGFLNVGATIQVTVQGKAATTINWSCVVHVTIV